MEVQSGGVPTPVMWLCGAPGVGKSTCGWGLYRNLVRAGEPVGYVDVDQLGMAPASPDDPDRHGLKARNAAAVLSNFRAHGARRLIVSGVVDPRHGLDTGVFESAGLALTTVRLRCAPEELAARYRARRGSPAAGLTDVLDYAATLDRMNIGTPLDTTGKSSAEVVTILETLQLPAPDLLRSDVTTASLNEQAPRSLLLVGPTAVGKSTVGWSVFQELRSANVQAAFLDVDQLGFLHPGSPVVVKAANLRDVSRRFRAVGTDVMIAVARAVNGDADRFSAALGGDRVTVLHLDASDADLAARVAHRAEGDGPLLAGDSLRDASPVRQHKLAARAAHEAIDARHWCARRARRIDTSGRSRHEVEAEILSLLH